MEQLTPSQKARFAISSFKTIAKAMALRGFYRPSGRMGRQLAGYLLTLSPEIYGSMTDPKVVELNGLEYVIDRLPCGIDECNRITLTDEDRFGEGVFERIIPRKRRRVCYRIDDDEVCFIVTRGLSEIYDILTHLSFLNIEAGKIQRHMTDDDGHMTGEWRKLEARITNIDSMTGRDLDQALWNLSLILGRSYQETQQAYERLEKGRAEGNSNSGLFRLVYNLGKRISREKIAPENALTVYMTPSLMSAISHQRYGEQWASALKARLASLGLASRPLHIISANLHSVVNLLYGHAAVAACNKRVKTDNPDDLYTFIGCIRDHGEDVLTFARENGMVDYTDASGSHIDCQIIDTAKLSDLPQHPAHDIDFTRLQPEKPVLLVMDYAFGAQAFEVMDCLLNPEVVEKEAPSMHLNVQSISVMGKAGILAGSKGEIMLANAHVIEGTSDNYMCGNDLTADDFEPDIPVHTGPMITVLGTSLQNRDLLNRFQESWGTIGLEMEGGHYQKAISAAIIKGHLPRDIRVRYAYYASDNPLLSGQTLAAGEMGSEGIRPTYMVTKAILQKIVATG
ncbi:MAG: hypothetical protein SWH61_01705 [Thermodesulfobacteriota bacterium]|nr:hypothetical protein [Thermodesulfobacteriota bacterium]